MHLHGVREQLVIAGHHRQWPFVTSKITDLDGCDHRPVELFGSKQVPDRSAIMTAHRKCLLDGNTQSVPAMARAEFEQLDHFSCALGSAMALVQRLPN